MKRALLALALLSSAAYGQDQFPSYSGTAANLPTCIRSGVHYTITNAPSTSDCTTTGGGSSVSECVCKAGTWTTVASGGGGGSVTSVTCGTGLTGGTITTSGTCAASFGSTSTTIARGNSTTNGVNGAKYDPDRRPSGCDNGTSKCDEFIGGFQQTWSQFSSQHGNTFTAAQDTAYMQNTAPAAARALGGYAIAAPTGTDWIACAKVKMFFNTTNTQAGMYASVGGTLTAPTTYYGIRQVGNTNIDAASGTPPFTSGFASLLQTLWNGGSSPLMGDMTSNGMAAFTYLYMRMRYVTSTKALNYGFSNDGLNWKDAQGSVLATTTVASDPAYIGLFIDDDSTTSSPSIPLSTPYIRVYWFRILTDATSTTAPYPCGS